MRSKCVFVLLVLLVVAPGCGAGSSSKVSVTEVGVGETRTGTVDPSVVTDPITLEGEYAMHYYSFTAPAAGTYAVQIMGDSPVQVTQCAPGDVGEYGCLCNLAIPTCCSVEDGAESCTFDLLDLAAGQEVLLVVGTYGSEPAAYALDVAGP